MGRGMKKYNVGDKVKCVETKAMSMNFKSRITPGKIYTINFLMFDGDGIGIKDDIGYNFHFHSYQHNVLFKPFNMENDFENQNYEEWIEE